MTHSITERIARLDPDHEYWAIVNLLTCYEFPWDLEQSLQFALFRTYAVPSISRLLAETGEFLRRPRKRYDDTELILYEIVEHGFESVRGRAALRRMNQMHGHFPISNDDFLYVLSTFVFEPIRWIDRFGWRSLTAAEKQALFRYYRELGRHMNIDEIPADIATFERFNRDYEASHFQFAETNRTVGAATRDLFLGFYLPRWLWPLGKPFIYAMLDDALLQAFGFPSPPAWLRRVVQFGLIARARFVRFLPERTQPALGSRSSRSTYPEGYEIEELGTFK